jgi:hypothetical protein
MMRGIEGLWRSRWAAIGAAVAVSMGAGGFGIAHATVSTGSKPVYVPITPCRLLDTRPATNVGPRNTPIGANSEYTITVHGTNGNCTIPTGAVGIMMNTTVVNGTVGSFLTVFPADVTRPNASSMNWVAAQPPTPNEIGVKLSADGKIKVYNLVGTVDVVGDIVGYFEDHIHGALKQITLPAHALDAGGTVITRVNLGLNWANNFVEAAFLTMHRPVDFAGTGTVTLKLLYTRTTTAAGNVQFFARPRDYESGDAFLDASSVNSDIQATADTNFHEVTMLLPANTLPKAWWDIVIQRNDTVASPYAGDVVVRSVELTYEPNG